MKIFVVIPNLNGADYLISCLDSLMRQSILPMIVVVDNGSQDNSVEIIENYERVILIKKSVNTGFSGGVNAGINYAISDGAKYVVLLNNDAVAKKDWLEKLIKTAEDNEKAGIVASKMLLGNTEYIDSTGEEYSIWGVPFPRGRNMMDQGQYDNSLKVFAASGGASLYRSEVFKQIGNFDEDYFAYLEDVDISFRARLAGWQIMFSPEAIVHHQLSATSSILGRDFVYHHFIKNLLLLYSRNMPLLLFIKYLPLFLLHMLRLFIGSIFKRQLFVFLSATTKAIALLPKTLSERKKRMRAKKITASSLDSLFYRGLPPRPPKIKVYRG